MDEQELYTLEFLNNATLLCIIKRMEDKDVYFLSLAIPALLDRLPRMQWIQYDYLMMNSYACPFCARRFSYTSQYYFHVEIDHKPRTRNEFLERVSNFFSLKLSRRVKK